MRISNVGFDQLHFQLFDETGQTLFHAEQNTYLSKIRGSCRLDARSPSGAN
jgi:hypothetical protein